jgi:hypothetical protein
MGLCKAFADDRKWNERSVVEMECELSAFECRLLEIKAVCKGKFTSEKCVTDFGRYVSMLQLVGGYCLRAHEARHATPALELSTGVASAYACNPLT